MWAYESSFYQIYPLGFCGAPFENDGVVKHRILKVLDWVEHIKKLGMNAIYFSPVFESDTHGYNTRDYTKIDCRLGTNEDFTVVCKALHDADIKVVLDGVFNHVGRGFWAFEDVLKNREDSPYKDWFIIDFNGNSNYNDGLWYEGWEGHFDLVKLNLKNPAVTNHILECVKGWVEEFDIDGLRLDVAYSLDHDFLRKLRQYCDVLKSEFFLLGETLHGDYNQFANDQMLHSVTNYECYKGLFSSFNCMNMFEICHSLNRQFGSENWTIYKGKHFLCFVDNHDVSRIATILTNKSHLPVIYGMLFAMPGIPCIYYGSEWGAEGDKKDGDSKLRLSYEKPIENDLSSFITKLATIHAAEKALCYGSYQTIVLTNKQCIFQREYDGQRILIAINADAEKYSANFNAGCSTAIDLITKKEMNIQNGVELPPYGVYYLKCC